MIKHTIENCTLYHGKCEEIMEILKDKSIDSIITDPPYLYLKNQKLDIKFNEKKVFAEWKRILKNDSIIAFFGRGDALFRWNLKLGKLGFNFRESAVWEKERAGNPMNDFLRIHEDISFRSLGDAKIRKTYIDYLEYFLSKNQIESIKNGYMRLKSALNGKDKEECIRYIESGVEEFKKLGVGKHCLNMQKPVNHCCAGVGTLKNIKKGKRECSILKCNKEYYSYKVPTQKPVVLMERIIKLVSDENNIILDCFMGSGSTGVACMNTNRKFIGIEIDKEYFEIAKSRIEEAYNNKCKIEAAKLLTLV